jgi:hypothetical protein
MGYSLDGQDNVTTTENTLNLTGLTNGSHNIIVYANDTVGNTGATETFTFTVAKEAEPDTTPTALLETVALIAAVFIVAVLYLKKRQKPTQPQ